MARRSARSGIANVRTYAGNLRRSLDSYADDRLRIVREPDGYRLLADESLIDLYRLTLRWCHARELMRAGALAVPLLEDVGATARRADAGTGVERPARGREPGTLGARNRRRRICVRRSRVSLCGSARSVS